MNYFNTISLPRWFVYLIPATIMLLLFLITKTQSFANNSHHIALGIQFDLLITIPLVYYLLIRNTSVAKSSVLLCVVFSVTIGTYILPEHDQKLLGLIETWLLPFIELAVMIFLFLRLRTSILNSQDKTVDTYNRINKICEDILFHPFNTFCATELGVLYYGCINWKRKSFHEQQFTYHQNSGTQAIMIAFAFILLLETGITHFLLIRWNETLAWILTLLSFYVFIQIWGFARSLSKRPIEISGDKLLLRYGILGECTIKLSNITSIDLVSGSEAVQKLSPLKKIEEPNIVLNLCEVVCIHQMYGRKIFTKQIAFFVDDKLKLKAMLERLKG